MSRKINKIPKERLFKNTMRTVTEDNIAIRKAQRQQRQAITELTTDVGRLEIKRDVTEREMRSLVLRTATIETNLWVLSGKLRKERQQNRDLRRWLEGYIILLFAIVMCFGIVVFVS